MTLPDLPDLPPDSRTPVDTQERRFEELAMLQRLLLAEWAKTAALEAELAELRHLTGGVGEEELQGRILALGEDLDRLDEALTEKERARFELEEDLRALTEDHYRLTHALETRQGGEAPEGPTRAALVLEIRKLKQALALQGAALRAAEERLSRSRLSDPFEEGGADPDGLSARSERAMRRAQTVLLTELMARGGGADG